MEIFTANSALLYMAGKSPLVRQQSSEEGYFPSQEAGKQDLFLSAPASQRSELGLDLGWDCCPEWRGSADYIPFHLS